MKCLRAATYSESGVQAGLLGRRKVSFDTCFGSEPSRLMGIAQAFAQKTTTDGNLPTLRIRVLDSTATQIGFVTAYSSPLPTHTDSYPLTAVGLIKDGTPLVPVTLAPGDYTLELAGVNFGPCAGSVNYLWTSLDYILLGSG